MRRAARIDDNQHELVNALRAAGAKVISMASVGGGFPDLLVGWNGQITLLEVKDGKKPPCEQRLTPKEKTFHDEWRGYRVHVVRNVIEALDAVGIGWEV